jgi:hypothetical protein
MNDKFEFNFISEKLLLDKAIKGDAYVLIQLMEKNFIEVNAEYYHEGKYKTILSLLIEHDTVENAPQAEGYKKMALYLLSKGADLGLRPYSLTAIGKLDDHSPLEILSHTHTIFGKNILPVIRERVLLDKAIKGKANEFIQCMEEKSINVNTCYYNQGKYKTILSFLIEHDTVENGPQAEGYKKMALYLLSKGADLRIKPINPTTGMEYPSPLEILSQRKNLRTRNPSGRFLYDFSGAYFGKNILPAIEEFNAQHPQNNLRM